jgi:hypothetical protein
VNFVFNTSCECALLASSMKGIKWATAFVELNESLKKLLKLVL